MKSLLLKQNMTKEEAYVQLAHRASLLKAVIKAME
jgi:hypothetical protein